MVLSLKLAFCVPRQRGDMSSGGLSMFSVAELFAEPPDAPLGDDCDRRLFSELRRCWKEVEVPRHGGCPPTSQYNSDSDPNRPSSHHPGAEDNQPSSPVSILRASAVSETLWNTRECLFTHVVSLALAKTRDFITTKTNLGLSSIANLGVNSLNAYE